jgi:hypothetical protein
MADLSVPAIIEQAADCGVRVSLNVDSLVLKAATKPPAALLAKLEQHKAEIVALLRQEADEAASAATSRPSWWPKPHPDIVREPPFGSDGVPPRYRAARDVLLPQCPSGMAPFVWETAMHDTARLFGDFGIELERLAWKPDDLFGLPHGLVWFINGNYAPHWRNHGAAW